jgi:azurin
VNSPDALPMAPVRSSVWSVVLAAVMALAGVCSPACWGQSPEKPLAIRAVEGLRFDPPRLRVEPGQVVSLHFENADTTAQPHNLVVVRPGAREAVLAAALALGADGPARGYVPAVPDVLAASRLLAAGESEVIRVTMPKEPGIYPIVCTFPGHGVIMFGAVYAGIEMSRRVEDDPHVPKPPPPVALDPDPRPMVRRMFLPQASPAAIAVALPGGLNLCWDAGPCRLRYVWRGDFLSADAHFEGKGQALARLGGPVCLSAPAVFPVRPGGREPEVVAFRGYALNAGLPTFEYNVDGKLVKEGFSVDGDTLIRWFQVAGMTESLEIRVGMVPSGPVGVSRGGVVDGGLQLTPEEAQDVTLRYPVPAIPGKEPDPDQ